MHTKTNSKDDSKLDVDVRFLLANERTLLAWVRTGLTLIAGGVAVAFITNSSDLGLFAGIGAVAFGGCLSLLGYSRYVAADKSIRNGELPPRGHAGLIVVVIVIIFALALILLHEL